MFVYIFEWNERNENHIASGGKQTQTVCRVDLRSLFYFECVAISARRASQIENDPTGGPSITTKVWIVGRIVTKRLIKIDDGTAAPNNNYYYCWSNELLPFRTPDVSVAIWLYSLLLLFVFICSIITHTLRLNLFCFRSVVFFVIRLRRIRSFPFSPFFCSIVGQFIAMCVHTQQACSVCAQETFTTIGGKPANSEV